LDKNELKTAIKYFLPYGYIKSRDNKFLSTEETTIEPAIYNRNGNRKRTFYLQDRVCKHSPYSFSSMNVGETQFINWDRSNIALPIHFYSHNEIFNKQYKCKKKFGIIVESETIIPELYEKCIKNEKVINSFDGIFTHSDRLLDKYNNTYFIPGSSVWYGGTAGGGILNEEIYRSKTKLISLVTSSKAQCELHKYRMQLAEWLYDNEKVDVMGTFKGGKYISISESLSSYRYSIVVENNITSCYFTEKLLNCFAAMTIPIYIGAKDIACYFNTDGIIQIDPGMKKNDIISIVNGCTEELYTEKTDFIKDNYRRVQNYQCIEDYIFKYYKRLFE